MILVIRDGCAVMVDDALDPDLWGCPGCGIPLENTDLRAQFCTNCRTDLDPDLWDLDEEDGDDE